MPGAENSKMCIFTRPIEAVSNTGIYARVNPAGEQYLAYAMSASLPEEMAMVLPLPVDRDKAEAITFLDLSSCPRLFEWLRRAFKPPEIAFSLAGKPSLSRSRGDTLPVVEVGGFEASYVPGLEDFERLDPRFQLDATVWDQLPNYADYGFAVFKLKAGRRDPHPMALKFPTRHPRSVFFPTVHVHEGTVPPEEQFDHELYLQTGPHPGQEGWVDFEESQFPLGYKIPNHDNTRGVVVRAKGGFRRVMKGRYPNRDVLVAVTPVDDPPQRNVAMRDQAGTSRPSRPGLGTKDTSSSRRGVSY